MKIKQGDTVLKVASQKKIPWQKIWDDPNNQKLKKIRNGDPDILLPDDVLYIPEFKKKQVEGGTDQLNQFKYKKPKRTFYLELIDGVGELLNQHSYKLYIQSELYEGDCSSPIDIEIPIDVETGKLQVFNKDGVEIENVILEFDKLDPILKHEESCTGIQARLNNLGYFSGCVDNDFGPMTESAVRQFQVDNDLKVTGSPDDIIKKLKELYGC